MSVALSLNIATIAVIVNMVFHETINFVNFLASNSEQDYSSPLHDFIANDEQEVTRHQTCYLNVYSRSECESECDFLE